MQKAKNISENPDLRMYKISEISPMTGISEYTLKKYIRENRLKASFIAGRWRVSAANLKAFLEKGTERKSGFRTKATDAELESVPEKDE